MCADMGAQLRYILGHCTTRTLNHADVAGLLPVLTRRPWSSRAHLLKAGTAAVPDAAPLARILPRDGGKAKAQHDQPVTRLCFHVDCARSR